MKLSTKGSYGIMALLDLAVHQSEESVLLAEKDYKLCIRTSEALQINNRYPQKPMLLTKYSRHLKETYYA